MTKLSNAQAEILATAAQSDDGALATPAHAKGAVAGLIKRGFVISVPEGDGPSRLLITTAGRAAIAPQTDAGAKDPSSAPTGHEAPAEPPVLPASAAKSPPKGKIAALLDLLRQPEGATIEAMMAATGWQAHSVRGALSGAIKKNLGVAVVSTKTDGVRTYRIETGQ
jgi:hypothetical protein